MTVVAYQPKHLRQAWRPWRVRSHRAHPWRRHRWESGRLASGLPVHLCQHPDCDYWKAPW